MDFFTKTNSESDSDDMLQNGCPVNYPKLTANPAQVTNGIPGILLIIISCVVVTGHCQLL